MSGHLKSRIFVLLAALLFSTGGAAIKGNTLTAWQVAAGRAGIAALVIMLVIPETRRRWRATQIPAALAYAATLVLFVLANKHTTSANAIFLQSTAPLYLMFISPLLLREPLRRSDVVLIIAVGLGLSLFFISAEPAAATAPDPFTGNLLGAAAGLTWALTVASLRALSRGDPSSHLGIQTVVIGNFIAFAIALPVAIPVQQTTVFDFAAVIYLGIFQVGLAYVCLTRGVAHVPAFEAAALLLLEPAINPVWTWLLLGEKPAPVALAGGILILAATAANTWWHSRSESLASASVGGAPPEKSSL